MLLTRSSLALALFAAPGLALGDLYVDASATNCASATGTQADPFCTIAAAVAAASGGDTLHLAAGTYDESVFLDKDLSLIGTSGQDQTILRGVSGAPTLETGFNTGVDLSLFDLTITHAPGAAGDGVQFWSAGRLVLEDCTVRDNLGRGLEVEGFDFGADLEMRRCMVRDNGSVGVFAQECSTFIEETTVRANAGGGACFGQFTYAGYVAQLVDCVIEDNTTLSNGAGVDGGNTQTQLTDCIVRNNVSGSVGGGLYVTGNYYFYGSLTATNTTISGNQASSGGGAYSSASMNLVDCVVENNTATNDGGGACSSVYFRTTRTQFLNNHADDNGGGFCLREGLVWGTDFDDSLFEGNSADGNGGAIAGLLDIQSLDNDLWLVRCTLRDNTAAGDGGGIWVRQEHADQMVFVENSTLSGNSAARGGAMFIEGVNPDENIARVRHSTVTDNTATIIGGGLSSCTSDGIDCVPATLGMIRVGNSIVAGNHAPQSLDLTGLYESLGGNLIGVRKGGNGFSDGVQGDQVGELEDPLDPGLAPLADNGGFAVTHALLAGSSAVDAALVANCLPEDQREIPRPFGAGCDAGAYEYDSLASLQAFGVGIAGSGGFAPDLSGLGSPVPGGSFVLTVEDGLGGGVGAILLGGELLPPLPLFGGWLYAGSLLTFPSALAGTPGAAGEGFGQQPVVVPNVPSLVGASFAAQGGYFDPGAGQGIALTNGVRILIGS